MPKRAFTLPVLENILQRDGATLIGEYPSLTRDTHVSYICRCGSPGTKIMRSIVENGGALCKPCGTQRASEKRGDTIEKEHGVRHNFQRQDVKDNIVKTHMAKRGVAYPMQDPRVREKSIESNQRIRGVDHPAQSQLIQQKIQQTCLQRYGSKSPAESEQVQATARQTNMEKYGVASTLQVPEFREKGLQTIREKYGVDNVSQNLEIHEKQMQYTWKSYTMPSGAVRHIQGYEDKTIRELLAEGYSEEDIVTGRKRISYILNGKTHYYYPDFYIPSQNKFIETKSDYLYREDTERILAKKQACEEQGYLFEIRIYDKKGVRIN